MVIFNSYVKLPEGIQPNSYRRYFIPSDGFHGFTGEKTLLDAMAPFLCWIVIHTKQLQDGQ
jgi:hypothetical protein